jgi:hypothetical protein
VDIIIVKIHIVNGSRRIDFTHFRRAVSIGTAKSSFGLETKKLLYYFRKSKIDKNVFFECRRKGKVIRFNIQMDDPQRVKVKQVLLQGCDYL